MSLRQSSSDEDESSETHSSRPSGHNEFKLGSTRDHQERKKMKRSRKDRSQSRSRSRERRRSRSRERSRHHPVDNSRRHSPDRGKSQKSSSHYRKRERRSRSSSTERHERNNERSKLELRQQMQRNYEEQIEKLKNNQFGPLPIQNNNKSVTQVPVEPSKLVEQIEKRKFLFSKKDKPADVSKPSTTVWKQPAFSDDSDGKMTAKFKRLMGMKDDGKKNATATSTVDNAQESSSTTKKQEEYFAKLEQQYEIARATTHTQRGLGLGFSSRLLFPTSVPPKP